MAKRKTPFNPVVFESRTRYMQRIQEAVCDGYRLYTAGEVPLAKAPALCRKFAELYGVALDKNARYRRQAAKLGNARLLLHFGGQRVAFMLLVSPGDHPARQLEKLQDAQQTFIQFHDYELARQTVKGRNKPSWTWRLTKEAREGWQERLRLATMHHSFRDIVQAWHSLYRVPGFHGIRSDVGRLVGQWRAMWREHRGHTPCPVVYNANDMARLSRKGIRPAGDAATVGWCDAGFPPTNLLPTLFFVRKQADVGVRLNSLVRAAMHTELALRSVIAQRREVLPHEPAQLDAIELRGASEMPV